MNNIIPHSRPYIGRAEAMAAYRVIMSRHLAMGEKVAELEQVWAKTFHAEDAAMVGSGLAALRLSLLALGVGPGDEVIIPAYSCVALHNAVLSVGAVPVLADIDRDSWCIEPHDVEKRITSKTKAIIAVGLFGNQWSAGLRAFGLPVIGDYSHGYYLSCYHTIGIASFHTTKYLGASKGGMVYGDKQLIKQVRQMRYYGDQYPDARTMNDAPTDMDAAIILEQLKKQKEIDGRRLWLYCQYNTWLPHVKQVITSGLGNVSNYRYVVYLKHHLAAQVSSAMKQQGVYAEQPVWDYRHTVDWPNDLPVTDDAFRHCLSLPIYPDMTEKEQNRVVEVLKKCLT